MPATLEEQRRIVAELDAQLALVERARRAAEEMLEAAHALPGALMGRFCLRKGSISRIAGVGLN